MSNIIEQLGITKGPWELFDVGDDNPKKVPCSNGESILTIKTEDDTTVFGVVYEDADARLIATAPEMLMALIDTNKAIAKIATLHSCMDLEKLLYPIFEENKGVIGKATDMEWEWEDIEELINEKRNSSG